MQALIRFKIITISGIIRSFKEKKYKDPLHLKVEDTE